MNKETDSFFTKFRRQMGYLILFVVVSVAIAGIGGGLGIDPENIRLAIAVLFAFVIGHVITIGLDLKTNDKIFAKLKDIEERLPKKK